MSVRLSDYTTSRVGGPAPHFEVAHDRAALIETARRLYAEHDLVVLLGGGSNTVAGDEPLAEPVLHIASRGIEAVASSEAAAPASEERDAVIVRAEAGEPWDALVRFAFDRQFAGVEALAGIPGSVGAAPVQNIGAYGQELAHVLRRLEFYDADDDEVQWLDREQLGLGYRSSAIKRGERRGVVLRVELALTPSTDGLGAPVRYTQLAESLGVAAGVRAPLAAVRETVLRLRASKGMVLDPDDPDSVSSGSFFINPVVTVAFARELPASAPRYPHPPAADGAELVKLSAAWLIEHAGVRKGFALPGSRAAVSSKHTLAITNRGGATGTEIAELARFVQARVESEFGVRLLPEPVLLGLEL